METLATYLYNGQAGIVDCSYGSGKVVLFGPHPEIDEDSYRDGTYFGKSLDDNDSDWQLLRYVLSYLGASSSSVTGSYSRYDFTYYYNNGSGDYYTGYVYAPTGMLSYGVYLYNQPNPLGAGSLGGGYYYIYSVSGGYDSSYDGQEYITGYYDASAQTSYFVNSSASSPASYIYGHIHVDNRTTSYEAGYVLNSSYSYFSVYNLVSAAAASGSAGSAASGSEALSQYAAQSLAVWTAYWREADVLLQEK
jgi:hypothetical protein